MNISIILSILALLGIGYGVYKVVYKINHKLDKVVTMQPVMMNTLFACLDGLTQLGANGKVTEAKEQMLKTLINE